MAQDPETIKHLAAEAMQHSYWWQHWSKEIFAGAGVVSLWVLRFIGRKEIERRKVYATVDAMQECQNNILLQLKMYDEKNEERVKRVHDRLDQFMNTHG